MILRITLASFYSRGDERRLFQGFDEISAIKGIRGEGRDILLEINLAMLGKESLRELVALLWRYDMSLSPLQILAEKRRFSWLNDSRGFWYSEMFPLAERPATHRKTTRAT